jgi:RNA polymerase sigma-70 factor (ECF subfamily)
VQIRPSRSTTEIEFATFMRAYQDMVFSTAARLTGNAAQAEDIAQVVFLKAYEHFDQLRAMAGPGGWLKTVATRLTLNYLRRHRNRWRLFSELRSRAPDDDESHPSAEDLPAPETLLQELDAHRRSAIIEQVLAALPDHQRIPLVLYHFEDMPYEEIASTTGVSLSKVKTDIHRGRQVMAAALARRGITGVADGH